MLDAAIDTVNYTGRTPSIAHYVCVTSPVCDIQRPNIFIANGVSFVATFQDQQTVNVYVVPLGALKVTSPDGGHVFPLIEAGAGFADTAKPVTFNYQGTVRTLYLDFQNDCFPLSNGACQCSTC
jgi:hypothetical protein